MDVVGLHHVALNVDDLDASLAFYVDVFGFTVLDRPDFGIPGAWLQAGTHQVHLVVEPAAQHDPRQHFALQVRDVEAVAADLEAAGLTVRRAPYVPGAGRQLFLRDPSGNRIELNQPDHA
jgi:glyoxylase I family protein